MSHHRYQSAQNLPQVDDMITRLLETDKPENTFKQSEIKELINYCRYVISDQPLMLEIESPVKIVGDIHGQFSDLKNIFKMSGYPTDTNYLFLGNYVDRGYMSLQCILLLICYKIKYPENIFLLRGNHQLQNVNRFFGFFDECKKRVGIKAWVMFNELFTYMPLCAVIDRRILCVHGGLSPEMDNLDQLNKYSRPLEITNQGIPIDLLSADPDPTVQGWHQNQRGVSFVFGLDSIITFLRDNGLDLVVRSNQLVETGYEFLFNRALVTIFSAPNFQGYQNCGAIMAVDENLKYSFEIIKPKSTSVGKNKSRPFSPVKK